MNKRKLFFIGLCFLFIQNISAQDQSKYKYGEITTADFNVKTDKFDSGANAIILADIGKVNSEENEIEDFDVIYRRFLRIKIINKNGLDAGHFILHINTRIPNRSIIVNLAKPGLEELKGVTFNLENGKIKKDYLDLASVFSEKEGKDRIIEKFAMPALKEGSIFDIEYTIRSASLVHNINWDFQSAYPCLWSEYDLTLADAYRYTIKYQGDSNFYVHSVELVTHVSEDRSYHEKLSMSHFRWVKINEPAITQEAYVGSLNNYVDRVSFQHEWYVRIPYSRINYSSANWEGFSNLYFLINGMEDFADDRHNWMKKDLETVTAGLQTKNEIARAIYRYVRDHFSCINDQDFFISQPLKETYQEKNGNVADINLLLTAMLHRVRIEADPAVLSTIENGYGNLTFPLVEDYNYMICVAKIDGKDVLLDASRPLNAYGILPPDCYNGGAVTLNTKQCRLVELLPKALNETNRTDVIITSDEKGILTGSLTIHCGTEKSHNIREEVKKTSINEFFVGLMSNMQMNKMSNGELDELANPDNPITVHCDMDFKDSVNADIIYLNPVVLPRFKSNPFIPLTRKYLVEMPYRMDDIYLLSMDIPKGYRVEEMPASLRIRLNSDDGSFEYIIEKNADNVQLQIRMKLNKTFFTTEEYAELREFFIAIIKKESEHIVLKKIK
jgi:hypothetical protein